LAGWKAAGDVERIFSEAGFTKAGDIWTKSGTVQAESRRQIPGMEE
jgi:hypothetical protein